MTFIFLFIIKNAHFIKSHILSFLNFENTEIRYSNEVSPLFSYPRHFKNKTKQNKTNILYMNVCSFYYIFHCMPEFFCTCSGWISLSVFSLPLFSFTSLSQGTCKTFFWKIFLSVKYISWFHVVISVFFIVMEYYFNS